MSVRSRQNSGAPYKWNKCLFTGNKKKIWVCASKASSKRLPLSPHAQNASKQCSEKQARSVSRRKSNNAHPGMDNETPESDKYWQMLH